MCWAAVFDHTHPDHVVRFTDFAESGAVLHAPREVFGDAISVAHGDRFAVGRWALRRVRLRVTRSVV